MTKGTVDPRARCYPQPSRMLSHRLFALSCRLLGLAVLASVALPGAAQAAALGGQQSPAASPAFHYFPQTGHLVAGPFKTFFDTHGGLDVFGLPRTEAIQEDGMTVQYFQRARMEWHPRANRVELGLLGSILTAGRQFPPVPEVANGPGVRYFPETSHTVHDAFLSYFNSRGGVEVFGYPISEERVEGGFRVQYFQRARMEWHPELPPAYSVSLTLLGDQYIDKNLAGSSWLARVPPPTLVAQGLSNFATSPPNRVHNVLLMASKLNGVVVPDGGVFSFDAVMGDVTAAAGWREGLVINGNQTEAGLGGGICQVSTTAFRAAFWAGLPIVERHDHVYPVPYYTQGGAPEGFDATVWSPTLDLKFRNDTGAPLLIATRANLQTMNLRVELYGKKVDRVVQMQGPFFSQRVPHPAARYVMDSTLAAGQVEQTDWPHDGLNVVINRVVTQGTAVHVDRFASHYVPWAAVYHVGPQPAPAPTAVPSATPEVSATDGGSSIASPGGTPMATIPDLSAGLGY
ncbi:MAG: VanW family protein [Chloroflexota bacterium]